MGSSTTPEKGGVPAAVLERLERDKGEWELWRRSRGKGERIPRRLWRIALSYVGELPLSRISREFRVDYNHLKRLSARRARLPKERADGPARFIELTPWLPTGEARPRFGERPSPTSTVVLERPDGSRVRIEGALPDVGYLRALLGLFYGGF
jgi:hypothetical protein